MLWRNMCLYHHCIIHERKCFSYRKVDHPRKNMIFDPYIRRWFLINFYIGCYVDYMKIIGIHGIFSILKLIIGYDNLDRSKGSFSMKSVRPHNINRLKSNKYSVIISLFWIARYDNWKRMLKEKIFPSRGKKRLWI